MNLKKNILSLVAAGTLLVSGGISVVAQSASSTTQGTVQITDTGAFDVQFCDSFSFDPVDINSLNPGGDTNGTLMICYEDTHAHRGSFRTYIQAGHFSGPTDWFANSNVKPSFMYNVAQGQWGSGIGNIGAMTGQANYNDGGYVNGSTDAPSSAWLGGDLSSPQYVGYGWEGIGTGGNMYMSVNGNNYVPELQNGSVATIDLELTIPTGLEGGSYTSVFTLNVTPATP